MRLKEFEKAAIKNIAEKHNLDDTQVKEALPALAGLGRLAAGTAMGAGRLAAGAAKGAANLGSRAAAGIGNAAKSMAKQTAQGAVKSAATSAIQKVSQKAQQDLSQQIIKKGNRIPFPTQSGQAKDFEVGDIKGDEVTLINPDARNKPDEPEKLVYKKKDIDTVVQTLAKQQ